MDQAVARPLSGAIAVWVKTPGLSSVKTRLAASIGTEAAEEFYRRSVEAVEAVVRDAAGHLADRLSPYWAVAEQGALEHAAWQGFPTVFQGDGGLGTRLSHVYDALRVRHPWVLFVGADAPQITPELIEQAAEIAAAGDWVLGPAEDGGFYLFGGTGPLSRAQWERVPYSTSETGGLLARELQPLGRVRRLPPLFDVDTDAELAALRALLSRQTGLLPAQRALSDWLGGLQ